MNKKKIIKIISIIAFLLLIAIIIIITIPKQTTWHYKLHNNYEIWYINSAEIILGQKENDTLIGTIENTINEFKYNETYVITKTIDSETSETYYIVNMQDNTVYGPYNKEECQAKEKELNINIDNWIKTKPTPKEASYN